MSKGFQSKQTAEEPNTPLTAQMLATQLKVAIADLNMVLDHLGILRGAAFTELQVEQVKSFVQKSEGNIRKYLSEQIKEIPSQSQFQSQPQTQSSGGFSESYSQATQGNQHQADVSWMAQSLEKMADTAQVQAVTDHLTQTALKSYYLSNPDQITNPEARKMLDQANQMYLNTLCNVGRVSTPLALGLAIPQLRELPHVQAAVQQFTSQFPDQAALFLPPSTQDQKVLKQAEATE
jgi:hypothetical protein